MTQETHGLTAKQHKLLGFIREYIERYGYAPSFDEMREHMGLKSKSGIHRLVWCLEDRGHILILRDRARAIQLVDGRDISVSDAIVTILARCRLSSSSRDELLAMLKAE